MSTKPGTASTVVRSTPTRSTHASAASTRRSRATVYRYFRNRDELLLAVLVREAESFLGWLGRAIEREPDIEHMLVRGIVLAVEQIRRSDRLLLLFVPSASGVATGGLSGVAFDLGRHFARPYFERAIAEGRMRPDLDLDDALEWILRVAISLVSIDSPIERGPDARAELLRRYLLPALLIEPVASAARNER